MHFARNVPHKCIMNSWMRIKRVKQANQLSVVLTIVDAGTVDMSSGVNTVASVDIKEVQHEEGEVQLGSLQH